MYTKLSAKIGYSKETKRVKNQKLKLAQFPIELVSINYTFILSLSLSALKNESPLSESTSFTISYVNDFFSEHDENRDYIEFHKIRYLYLLQLIARLSDKLGKEKIDLLDVGPMFQTNLIRNAFPSVTVHTMGEHYPINHLRKGERHIELDLNFPEKFEAPVFPRHHIILFAEVIEHLYTPPEIILQFLKKFLHEDGFIIIQTPNAVAIHKRLKILFGRHPYDLLSADRRGHFREYTQSELSKMLRENEFKLIHSEFRNYFNNTRTIWHRAFLKYQRMIPPGWRDGLTVIGQLQSSSNDPQ